MDTKKLRQKILDLAIHGKLVPQDPNDEPASVLLKRIKDEKERLIKEGKIKKSKKSAKCADTDNYERVPFEVPKSWVWTTLGEVGTWQSGGTPSRSNKSYYGGNIPWLKTGDLNDGLISDIPESITEDAVANSSAKINPTGSVLIAMYGATIGKLGILTLPATTNQACCACIEFNAISQLYLFYFLLSQRSTFISKGGGGAQPNISKEIIVNTFIPLPPLSEQLRIVKEIEKWFALIDQVEQGKADLQTIIKQTKNKILDLAIHGKLVPQDPNDEPAIELLKRINPDFTPLHIRHYMFGIPSSWTWCKLGDIAQSNIGLTYKPTDITDNGIPVYRSNNIRDRRIDKSDLVRVNAPILEKQFLNIGDLLICARNGSRRLVGKCAIIEELNEATSFGAFMAVCRSKYNKWIFNLLNTTYFDRYLDDSNSTAINQVTQRMLLALHIPLPPLSEQQRIVQKIEELFSVLDDIQKALEV